MHRLRRLAALIVLIVILALAAPPHSYAASALAACTYVVRDGDTLSAIADRFNTSPSDLAAVNGLEGPSDLKPGATLVIPDCTSTPTPPASRSRPTNPRARLTVDAIDTLPEAHDIAQLLATFSAVPLAAGQPTCIIAHTHKGQGVSFMRDQAAWHHRVPDASELAAALAELEEAAL